MSEPKQILAKLHIIEDMATEASVKQLCKVMQEYIQDSDKSPVGFAKPEVKKT